MNVSRLLELKLINKKKNIYTPGSQIRAYVFLDDLNLVSSSSPVLGFIDTLIQERGWFSQKRKKYLICENTSFFGALSINESELDPLNHKLGNLNQGIIENMIVLHMDELDCSNLVSIFSYINENLFQEQNLKVYFSFIN